MKYSPDFLKDKESSEAGMFRRTGRLIGSVLKTTARIIVFLPIKILYVFGELVLGFGWIKHRDRARKEAYRRRTRTGRDHVQRRRRPPRMS